MPPAKQRLEHNQDRRLHRRYPISVDVRYTVGNAGSELQVAHGRTINLSSGGVLFETEGVVPVNARIELSISWPSRAQHQIQLELRVAGETIRVEGRHVAIKFDESIFCTPTTPNAGEIDGTGA